MLNDDLRAKVFISCGQTHNTDEVKIAKNIKDQLCKLGFDPYIAIEEQSLRGVKENIFGQLETSEYFVFIDFKRESLKTDTYDNVTFHRGSLFTNQELALASYLDIPLLAFQEDGVKPEDGIMRFLQGNAIQFTDRDSLPGIICNKVQKLKWKSHWKNQLIMEIPSPFFRDVPDITLNKVKRCFHIQVRNLHLHKPAINCSVYLEKIVNLTNNTEIAIETTGIKWRGATSPNTAIAPMSYRNFNIFWTYHNCSLEHISFEGLTDTTDIFESIPTLAGFKDIELTYLVLSANFTPIRKTFQVHICNGSEEITFQEKH